MEQVNEGRYRVKPGETVTIRVGGVGVSPTLAVFSSSPEATFDPHTGKYEFTVDKPAGKVHVGRLSAAFPTGTADNAQFTTVVSGSLWGVIYRTHDQPDRSIQGRRFYVRGGVMAASLFVPGETADTLSSSLHALKAAVSGDTAHQLHSQPTAHSPRLR